MSGPDVQDRLAGLEQRLRAVEDELAITRLVLSYGPLVDHGDAEGVADLWHPDGTYDVDTGMCQGRSGIAGMVRSPEHQGLLRQGCAHLLTGPVVSIDGSSAVAVGHSQLVVRGARGFQVLRATAHRWELTRTSTGWAVVRRTARLLDGRPEARALLTLGAAP